MYTRVTGLFFSPCGTVDRTVRAMADAAAARLGMQSAFIDCTLPAARRRDYAFGPGQLVFVGMPVYAGRVPNKLMPFVRDQVRGTGAAAVPVVCFGNRSFDNALAELAALLRADGFVLAGAAALSAQHSFTLKLAPGRPTAEDLAQAAAFAVQAAEAERDLPQSAIPGQADAPYYTPLGADGRPGDFLRATPTVDYALCTHCGTCAAVCPMGSVDRDDPGKTRGVCIKCQACIHKCRRHARSFTDPAFLSHVVRLEQTCQRPAEPTYIL